MGSRLLAEVCGELSCGGRRCPDAREQWSAHSAVSWYEYSTQGDLYRNDIIYLKYTNSASEILDSVRDNVNYNMH